MSVLLLLLCLCGWVMADFDCSVAPDQDIEKACMMIQEWDSSARKAIRKRQLFGGPPAASLPSVQGCRNLNCFCQLIGNRPGCGQRAYRREYRMLSEGERQRFHGAILALKRSGEYDRIANMHREVGTASGAHSGPGFLPWHREYMKRMELALRAIDPSISLPYWDSVLDSYLPNVRDSIMFTAPFMGDTDGAGQVNFGAFSNFRTLEGRPTVTRRLGAEGRMFTENNIWAVLNQNQIQNVMAYTAPQAGCPFPTNFQALEYSHSSIHLFVGGDMKPPTTSANDPIFFLHHCFVDLIWEMWRQSKQSRAMRETQYPPDIGTCANSQHFSYAQMRPWDMVNREGIANYYTDNLFSYAPRPSCSRGNANCGTPYLFCDTRGNPHCVSKIRLGGLCSGFEGFDACFGGICQGGRCQQGVFGGQVTDPPPASTPQPVPEPPVTSEVPSEVPFEVTTEVPLDQRSGFAGTTPNAAQTTFLPTTANTRTSPANRVTATQRTTTNTRFSTTRQQTRAPLRNTSPTVSSGAASTTCFNDDPCCEPWSRTGECRSNPAYMSRYCRRSCHYCSNPTDNQQGCVDRHPSCAMWRNQNYCTRRRQWMSENCQRSCGWCNQSKQQLCQASARRF